MPKDMSVPPRFFSAAHGKIYVGNEIPWTQTVNRVTEFLNTNLKPGEQFFALPYDCIYYFLTNRPSPSRQLIFFDHIKITPTQEVLIINELSTKNVAYVVLSNRMASSETGLGVFGKTYCPFLGKYIADHYKPISRFGDWSHEPGWAWSHGTQILQRMK